MAVALFVPTLVGLYSRMPGAATAKGTVLVSVGVTIVTYLATEGVGIGILTPYAIGILSALGWMGTRMWTVDRHTAGGGSER
jgi:hypothetical protein